MTRHCACVLLMALLPVTSTWADQFEDGGLYLGGAYGVTTFESGTFDDDDNFTQLFAGLQILPVLGIEAAYYDFGEYGSNLINLQTTGYSVALTGRLPLTPVLAVFLKAGPMWWDTDVNVGPLETSLEDSDLMIGAGLSFEIARNFDLRLSYERVDFDLSINDAGSIRGSDFDSELDMISLGLKLEF